MVEMTLMGTSILKVGDWVEVRSKEEILATLDKDGQLEGMPFMPEMLAFCGRRMQVYKRAHKTCDTVFPVRGRRLDRTVHLDTRCDGSAHGGCQAGCLLFWKEAWLKRVDSGPKGQPEPRQKTLRPTTISTAACTEAGLFKKTRLGGANGALRYACQATQLPYFTRSLAWWDLRQYWEDYSSGNTTLGQILRGFFYSLYYNLSQAGIGVGPLMRWLYEQVSSATCGRLWPRRAGTIPKGEPTPAVNLDLQPGELVRVKSHAEILATLTTESRNRGMLWDAELLLYCGGTYRVLRRVTKIIEESTGEMCEMKTPSIILDKVVCQSRYSNCRMFCPRGIYSYWREAWLERVIPSPSQTMAPNVEAQDLSACPH